MILPVLIIAVNMLLLQLRLLLSASLAVCGAHHVVGRVGTAVVKLKAWTVQ